MHSTCFSHPVASTRPRRRRLPPLLAGTKLAMALLLGAAVAPAQSPVAVDPLDGPGFAAELLALGPGGARLRVGGEERALGLDELVGLRFGWAPLPAPKALARVVLANGAQLRGNLVGGVEERLRLRFGARAELELAYGSYRSVRVEERVGSRTLERPAEEGLDRAYRTVGDALDLIDGIVVGYDELGVSLEDEEGRPAFVPWNELAALLFPSDGEAEALPPTRVVLRLRDGSALEGVLRDPGEGTIVLAVGEGELAFVLEELAGVEVVQPHFVRLGELEPSAIESRPYFDDGPPPVHVLDRSLFGGPLRVGGVSFSRGIALRPVCDLSYALDGGFSALRVRVGIDDGVQPERHVDEPWFGTVRFSVEVDGEVRWTSPIVRAGMSALEVPRLDLRGARTLVLRTDFADRFPAGDFPVWIEPLLVR